MLALNNAIIPVANSNMKSPLHRSARWSRRDKSSSAFQVGFIAPEKWFRCGGSACRRSLPSPCGSHDTASESRSRVPLLFESVLKIREKSDATI
jgi:hypothetical protein